MGFISQLLAGTQFRDEALQSMAQFQAPHRICDSYIKAYPVEYHAQSAVDVAISLYQEIGDWRQIARIEVETFRAAYEIIVGDPGKWHPATRETADHSLQYIVAAALLGGEITPQSFDTAHLGDERIRRLLSYMAVKEAPHFTALYPQSIPVSVTVHTTDGSMHRGEARYPRGHCENPMSDEEVVAKFTRHASDVMDSPARQRLLGTVWHLDQLASIRELTTAWAIGARAH